MSPNTRNRSRKSTRASAQSRSTGLAAQNAARASSKAGEAPNTSSSVTNPKKAEAGAAPAANDGAVKSAGVINNLILAIFKADVPEAVKEACAFLAPRSLAVTTRNHGETVWLKAKFGDSAAAHAVWPAFVRATRYTDAATTN